jgi:TPR repeat protein
MKKISILFILFAFTALNANAYNRLAVEAQKGNALAQYNLGLYYKQSKNQHPRDAFRWMHKSALKGYRPAQYEFALMFHYGIGVKQNFDLARLWLKRAAKKGEMRAKIILYRFYAGKKIEPNMRKTYRHYSQNFRTIRQ